MKKVLEYKGYSGSVEFSATDETFFGKIIGIRDLVTFEASSVSRLKKAFKESVEDYIATCKQLGKDPDKEHQGSLSVSLNPRIHRLVTIKSAAQRMSLNQFVEKALERELAGTN